MNQIEYKFNFITGGTFELMWMIMYIIFIDVLFLHTESINGWNEYRMLLLTFQGGLMDSIFTFCIVPGLKRLPEMINRGTLDFILFHVWHVPRTGGESDTGQDTMIDSSERQASSSWPSVLRSCLQTTYRSRIRTYTWTELPPKMLSMGRDGAAN